MKATSKTVKETGQIAAKLAKKILSKNPGKRAVVIALEGELGAGKTVFAKAFAKALGIKTKITSPTFVIMKPYPFPSARLGAGKGGVLYHIDAYRLRDHRDLEALDINEIFNDPHHIVLIEWSDRVQKILPKKHTKIHIDHINEHERKITIE